MPQCGICGVECPPGSPPGMDVEHACPGCEEGHQAFLEDVRDGVFIGERMIELEERLRCAGAHTPDERVRAIREKGGGE